MFIDNDAARYALINGKSTNAATNEILHQFWEMAAANNMCIWFERVPSASNPADGPSRGDWEWCQRHSYQRIRAEWRGKQ